MHQNNISCIVISIKSMSIISYQHLTPLHENKHWINYIVFIFFFVSFFLSPPIPHRHHKSKCHDIKTISFQIKNQNTYMTQDFIPWSQASNFHRICPKFVQWAFKYQQGIQGTWTGTITPTKFMLSRSQNTPTTSMRSLRQMILRSQNKPSNTIDCVA